MLQFHVESSQMFREQTIYFDDTTVIVFYENELQVGAQPNKYVYTLDEYRGFAPYTFIWEIDRKLVEFIHQAN